MSAEPKISPKGGEGAQATQGTSLEGKDNTTSIEQGKPACEEDELPRPEDAIEALGIPNWRDLEKKIVRRLDITLMPCLWVLYIFNYLDRASIAQARLSTLDEDLGLKGYQFGTAVSILSAGYVLGQIPSNMIIASGYVRPSLYLPGCAIVWSGVSAATAGVSSYEGLLAVRFFLGVVEAPLLPGAVYLMSCWYTRKEMALRVAILYTGMTLANGTSGLISAAVFATLEGARDIAGWKWLFIVLASFGAFFAFISILFLPDYPHSKSGSATWSMTEDMRKIAQVRVAADRASEPEAKAGVWYGLRLCLVDYKLWITVLMNITLSMAFGFSNFFPSIVRGFGYTRTMTLVLTFPPYVLAAIGSVTVARSSDHFRERGFHYSGPVLIGMVGYIICMATSGHQARYAASYLYIGGIFSANPLMISWLSGILGKTPEKRAVGVALNNVLGQIGNFIAPFFFVQSDEPRYKLAFILMFVMAGVAISLAMSLKFSLVQTNKRLRRDALQNGTAYQPYIH